MSGIEKLYRVELLLQKLHETKDLTHAEWVSLIQNRTPKLIQITQKLAREIREACYGKDVYARGLIELSNHCVRDCYYCGIRRGNEHITRYRLGKDEVIACCKEGYRLGMRTFVLQGGEDPYYTDERLIELIQSIKTTYPDCAITLSVGERSYESYRKLKEAGVDRYLLRHETANVEHYETLHPNTMHLAQRKECLFHLKELGYQVGTGFMVGSPGQTVEHLSEDMRFLKELNPHMVGIGPYLPHHQTPFHNQTAGSIELTLYLLSLIRIMLPQVLLPSTTSLGTIASDGREQGILAGANVVMPNLSPTEVRQNYLLYDNKICTTDTAAMSRKGIEERIAKIGYRVVVSRGDALVSV